MSGGHLRGLTVFISDLRNCTSKEQEAKRVEKEMAHIRQKFTADAHMNGYNRKKYVWKILYMYMLGYEVDFGHMEAVNLLSSPKYSEKSVGYAWCALMLREGDELLRLIINSIRSDLISKNDTAFSCVDPQKLNLNESNPRTHLGSRVHLEFSVVIRCVRNPKIWLIVKAMTYSRKWSNESSIQRLTVRERQIEWHQCR